MDTGHSRWQLRMRSPSWRPPTDIYETNDTIVIRVEIAGMREDDFSIEIDGRILTIMGTRPDVTEQRAYHQMEIRFGEFKINFEFPIPVDYDKIDAVYKDVFLRVVVPKSKPRQIGIN